MSPRGACAGLARDSPHDTRLTPLQVLTVLELDEGVYVEKHRAEPPALVHLTRPFPVTIDLGRVTRG